jgi:hypothetical protein
MGESRTPLEAFSGLLGMVWIGLSGSWTGWCCPFVIAQVVSFRFSPLKKK